ncbi:PEP-CTERM sorting domain-containing protein [Pseudoduganella buxea]|uniref:PEP-CTERM sorting domain-containing protein n=1 Tax=Pseudoduganella buxea TaxID=1949069 RepID=A0A6I3SXN1_9BURK|nr:PEP-CTERM sorting domain-containing protein [Pseudoduganella buxea]MTV53834.1 PEP-CTERM sorting domain-containing protein [Pseudoduganella buxea]GGC01177.1 hypothetical protein GCM10011572_23930 [Pseudoduganella buxea]
MTIVKYMLRLLALVSLATAMSSGVVHAAEVNPGAVVALQAPLHTLQVDIAGIQNYDERGAENNVVLDFYVGPGASITSFRWDVNVTSYVGSYLSEMKITFSDTLGNGVTFTPGDGDDFDGTMDYAGYQDLGELGLVFNVGADGILRLEFHDGFKDLGFDEAEGVWNAGTLSFGIMPVPEPSAYATVLGGLFLLAVAKWRRHC